MKDGAGPTVSVVIPVYNDAGRLARCLAALDAQTWPKDRLEIVVVDNGSDDEPERRLGRRFPAVIWERELRPGSYAARNHGIEVSRGEILAFTDSDCVPGPRWIAEGVRALGQGPGIGLVGGGIRLFYAESHRRTAAELFEQWNAFRHEDQIRTYHFAVTANLFTRRSVMEAVGPFNADQKSGGDAEWGNRVHRAGYGLAYAPAARVGHPARRSLSELRKKTIRVQGGLRDWGQLPAWSPRRAIGDAIKSIRVVGGLIRRFCTGKTPSEDFRTASERIRYAMAVAFVETIRNIERFRLARGGASHR
jgi:GT2 family glycosyltransferase